MQTLNIASISGIVLTTMFVVEILKRMLHDKTFFQKIPVFVYSILIAGALTYLSNKVLHNEDGSPLLAGSFWKLLWASVVSSAGASGFYSWLRPESMEKSMKTPSHIGTATEEQLHKETQVQNALKLILLFILPLFMVGCTTCPEKAILRDSMDGTTQTIREMQLDWASKLVVDPATGKNHAADITPLTPAQYDQIQKTHEEYNELVQEDRQRDQESGGLFGGKK
jgi:hypothetical protein